MLRVSNTVAAIGGAVLAAGLLTLANPKTVHALAAALVQVTNTPSSPVITQGIGQHAAEIVEVRCLGAVCVQVLPDSTVAQPQGYFVPANQSLVITSADVNVPGTGDPSQACTGFSEIVLINGLPRERWYVAAGSGSLHFSYPAGIVIAPGDPLVPLFESTANNCSYQLSMHGYLTTN